MNIIVLKQWQIKNSIINKKKLVASDNPGYIHILNKTACDKYDLPLEYIQFKAGRIRNESAYVYFRESWT